MVHQFEAEAVLLQDLLVAPAVGAVEFGDKRGALFDSNLVDPVLVAVQGQDPPVADKPTAFDGVHDEAGCQGLKGMRGLDRHFFPVTRRCDASGGSGGLSPKVKGAPFLELRPSGGFSLGSGKERQYTMVG